MLQLSVAVIDVVVRRSGAASQRRGWGVTWPSAGGRAARRCIDLADSSA